MGELIPLVICLFLIMIRNETLGANKDTRIRKMHISIDITPHLVFLNSSKPHGFQKNFDSSNM